MKRSELQKLAMLSLLVALTVVLQLFATLLPVKVFGASLSFSLVPIVVAACFYGIPGAAIVGGSFGMVVFITGLTGIEPLGATCIMISPVLAFIAIVVRAVAASVLVALIFKGCVILFQKSKTLKSYDRKLSYVVAAVFAPVLNTGIFLLTFVPAFGRENAMLDQLAQWEIDGIGAFITGIVIINFIAEIITTILIAPSVCITTETVMNRRNSKAKKSQ
ncbi:MAG: hypothetical protein J5793_00010 [Clostridia bacterium]|nr:hypothetical protein [Clostridia bacterium]